MRIIPGKARGAKLLPLEGDTTRPTSERAKEAVFSMLQFEIEGRSVLDLFGGSGQLALEALSRGAKNAVIADSSKLGSMLPFSFAGFQDIDLLITDSAFPDDLKQEYNKLVNIL